MAIECVVFDVSGTLLQETDEKWPRSTDVPQPGVAEMLNSLNEMGLTVIAASNNPVRAQLERSGLLQYIDHVVEESDVGKPKGSKLWIDKFKELSGVLPHQMLYVGDADFDVYTASWGPMIYAHAVWSCAPGVYGLRALSPKWVTNVVRHIFRKQHPWYWTLDTTDSLGRSVRVMTLVDADGAGSPRAKAALLKLLKEDIDTSMGENCPLTLKDVVMLHMLASVCDSNLFGESNYWTTCPGHSGKPNTVMGNFLDVAAKLSRNKYKDDLLIRHTEARKSAAARQSGGEVEALRNQIETVKVGETYRKKIKKKRVLILDNFLTMGYSTEAARLLLLNAGASEVSVAAVGKYGPRTHVITPPSEKWDSFVEARPTASSFEQIETRGVIHPEALDEFIDSLNGISLADW